jgi:hypothetical protein
MHQNKSIFIWCERKLYLHKNASKLDTAFILRLKKLLLFGYQIMTGNKITGIKKNNRN